jgi:phenylacetic acid degradation operon negative regulatory protein
MTTRRPQDLVFTLFGDYLLHRGRAVWVGSLIELLRPLGLSAGATRTVLSRMARKGWLVTLRTGRRGYYELTERGQELLREGEARIHRPPRDEPWDGLWYLIAYSVPESKRKLRDRLRVRLQWLGFGQLGNGLWISPHRLRGEVNELAGRLGISEHLEIFRAQYQGYSSDGHLVAQCWDLPGVNARYGDFLARQGREYEWCLRELPQGRLTPEECYVRRFLLMHEYRVFPLIDPYLPERLLPADWQGRAAGELFDGYHRLLSPLAERHLESVLEVAPAVAMRSRSA